VAGGIKISFLSDVREFLTGTKNIEGALTDVSKSLDDVARDGQKAEKSFKETFDTVKRESRQAGDDIGRNVKRGFDGASDGVKDFKDEAKQNFAETASSFSGDMEGAVEGIQGTLGGLANSAIPGVGIAAGLAAAGIGTVYGILSTQAATTKQNIEDLTVAMIEANSKVIAESFIQQNLADIVSGADGAVISMANLREAATETGVPIATLARAYAGDPGSVAEALATVNTKFGEAQTACENYDTSIAASKTADELSRWKTSLEDLAGGYDSAAAASGLYQDAAALGQVKHAPRIASTIEEYQRLQGEVDGVASPTTPGASSTAQQALTATLAPEDRQLLLQAISTPLSVDVTLPGRMLPPGHTHLLARVIDDITDIFLSLGYKVVSGPEVELDYYNFEALNTPPHHPARTLQDTLYVSRKDPVSDSPDDVLLRTHTSPVQVRVMESERPPLYVISPGRAYRNDEIDATHSPAFHQVEGFAVAEGITMGDLKGTLEVLARKLFGADRAVRFRPHFFPFTEPSAEVDVSCFVCAGAGCALCKGVGWLEILGCGMIDPNVFSYVGYDPEKYTGFAFGGGVERIAMLKYGVNDMRVFFENDTRFLRQF